MGTTALNLQWVVSRTKGIMNKFLAVACVATVALVKGEADADAFYGPYGYGLGYAAYGAHPYTYGYAGYPYAYAAPSAYAQVSPSASLTTVGLADAYLSTVLTDPVFPTPPMVPTTTATLDTPTPT